MSNLINITWRSKNDLKSGCLQQALSACASKKWTGGKTQRQIYYISYCEWALKIMKFQQEDTFKR